MRPVEIAVNLIIAERLELLGFKCEYEYEHDDRYPIECHCITPNDEVEELLNKNGIYIEYVPVFNAKLPNNVSYTYRIYNVNEENKIVDKLYDGTTVGNTNEIDNNLESATSDALEKATLLLCKKEGDRILKSIFNGERTFFKENYFWVEPMKSPYHSEEWVKISDGTKNGFGYDVLRIIIRDINYKKSILCFHKPNTPIEKGKFFGMGTTDPRMLTILEIYDYERS